MLGRPTPAEVEGYLREVRRRLGIEVVGEPEALDLSAGQRGGRVSPGIGNESTEGTDDHG
jgi:hypothetical protein